MKNVKGRSPGICFYVDTPDVLAKRGQSLSLRQTSSKPTNYRGFFVLPIYSSLLKGDRQNKKACGEAAWVLSEV
jgi:hypothetical protein